MNQEAQVVIAAPPVCSRALERWDQDRKKTEGGAGERKGSEGGRMKGRRMNMGGTGKGKVWEQEI